MADARWSPVEQETLVEFWADEAVQISLNSMVHNREVPWIWQIGGSRERRSSAKIN